MSIFLFVSWQLPFYFGKQTPFHFESIFFLCLSRAHIFSRFSTHFFVTFPYIHTYLHQQLWIHMHIYIHTHQIHLLHHFLLGFNPLLSLQLLIFNYSISLLFISTFSSLVLFLVSSWIIHPQKLINLRLDSTFRAQFLSFQVCFQLIIYLTLFCSSTID